MSIPAISNNQPHLAQKNIRESASITPPNKFLDLHHAVCFKDKFCGPMPMHGMRFTEYKKAFVIYKGLVGFKGLLKFSKDQGPFIRLVKNSIKTLLTSVVGRDLLSRVYKHGRKHTIKIIHSETDTEYLQLERNKKIYHQIHLVTGDAGVDFLEDLPTGGNRRLRYPLHIDLGHELIHLLGYFEDPIAFEKRVNTPDPLLTNLEEEKTITGKVGNQEFSISEHALVKSFGESRIRWNHLAVPAIPKGVATNSPEFQEYWDYILAIDFREEVHSLIDQGTISLQETLYNGQTAFECASLAAGPELLKELSERLN